MTTASSDKAQAAIYGYTSDILNFFLHNPDLWPRFIEHIIEHERVAKAEIMHEDFVRDTTRMLFEYHVAMATEYGNRAKRIENAGQN